MREHLGPGLAGLAIFLTALILPPPARAMSLAGAQAVTTVQDTVMARAADLDRDGDADIMAVTNLSQLVWFPNLDGHGTFGPMRVISAKSGPLDVFLVRDMDNDSDPDILAASSLGLLSWYENMGNGIFSPPQNVDSNPGPVHGLWPADLDGDGDLDLVASREDTVTWYDNTDGKGGFGRRRYVDKTARAPGRVQSADFDRDGRLDLAVMSRSGGRVAVYFQTEERFLKRRGPEFSHPALDFLALDLDGDGFEDLLTSGPPVLFHQGGGQGDFKEARPLGMTRDGQGPLLAGDLDGDGHKDLVCAAREKLLVLDLEKARWAGEYRLAGGVFVRSLDMADLDGDGDADLVRTAVGDPVLAWHANLRSGRGEDVLAEGFETGGLLANDWDFQGSGGWTADTSQHFEGEYSATTAGLAQGKTAILETRVRLPRPGSLTFHLRLASGSLTLSLDGEPIRTWTGTHPWIAAGFAIPEGEHRLSWAFTPEGAGSAWLDSILVRTKPATPKADDSPGWLW